jgi:cell division protein FtsW
MAVFGIIMIFDASVYQANQFFNDQYYFLKLQVLWLIIGLVPALIVYYVDYKKLLKFSSVALGICIVLLVAVLLVGDAVNGSKRWFAIGPLPIQPAEFVKPIIIMYLATWLSKEDKGNKVRETTWNLFIRKMFSFFVIIGIVLLLIVAEPDLGTTIVIGVTAAIMFFLSDSNSIHTIGSLGMLGILGMLGAVAASLATYRLDRVRTFFHLLFTGKVDDPTNTGYQVQQILIGIGSGGLWGKGFGQSRQRFGYLVENTSFTDSIYAVYLEEFGFIGGIIMIFLWIGFFLKGLSISKRVADKQGQLLAAGITIWLTIQALFNMAANVGLIPLTGIPLPFLTYGGSSTLVTMIGFALLLNISRYTNDKNEAK